MCVWCAPTRMGGVVWLTGLLSCFELIFSRLFTLVSAGQYLSRLPFIFFNIFYNLKCAPTIIWNKRCLKSLLKNWPFLIFFLLQQKTTTLTKKRKKDKINLDVPYHHKKCWIALSQLPTTDRLIYQRKQGEKSWANGWTSITRQLALRLLSRGVLRV